MASQEDATASKDMGSVEMDGGAVGAMVVDGSGGGWGWGEELLLLWLAAKYSTEACLRNST